MISKIFASKAFSLDLKKSYSIVEGLGYMAGLSTGFRKQFLPFPLYTGRRTPLSSTSVKLHKPPVSFTHKLSLGSTLELDIDTGNVTSSKITNLGFPPCISSKIYQPAVTPPGILALPANEADSNSPCFFSSVIATSMCNLALPAKAAPWFMNFASFGSRPNITCASGGCRLYATKISRSGVASYSTGSSMSGEELAKEKSKKTQDKSTNEDLKNTPSRLAEPQPSKTPPEEKTKKTSDESSTRKKVIDAGIIVAGVSAAGMILLTFLELSWNYFLGPETEAKKKQAIAKGWIKLLAQEIEQDIPAEECDFPIRLETESLKSLQEKITKKLTQARSRGLIIYGLPGCGKTTAVKNVLIKLRKESNPNIRYLYVELKNNKNDVYKHLEKVFKGMHYIFIKIGDLDFLYHAAKKLKKDGKRFVLVVDDAQHIITSPKKIELIWCLNSLVEMNVGDVILIFSEQSEVGECNSGIELYLTI